MKVFPFLSGFGARARRAAAWAALAAVLAPGTAEAAHDITICDSDGHARTIDDNTWGTVYGQGWKFKSDWDLGHEFYQLSFTGSNTTNSVSGWADDLVITVDADCTIVASNLTLDIPQYGRDTSRGFVVTNDHKLQLVVQGSNVFHASSGWAGLGVPEGSTLAISGDGSLEATGGSGGAGIGGNSKGSAGTVEIFGGTITATGGEGAAGIGGGYNGSGGTNRISGGTVVAMGGAKAAGIGGGEARTYSPYYSWDPPSGGTVEISGGIVVATGGENGAGIGGGWSNACGSVTISAGSVTATGGVWAAGIGGGFCGGGGSVTVSGGDVTATGGTSGAGIGGGNTGDGGTFLVTDGTVTATGGDSAAGIGGGCNGAGGTNTVSGGTVTATGSQYGAGIGGGSGGEGGTCTIAGGTVTATGGAGAAGIGGGSNGNGGDVTISGGTVTATGGHKDDSGGESNGESNDGGHGAGIGGGNGGAGGTVSITGGDNVQATGGAGAAGIGGGDSGEGGDITISDGTVLATGGENGAGMGGGSGNACGTIAISGGNVTARGGKYAAGIGGGNGGRGGTVTIDDGVVMAYGGENGAGIGGGRYGTVDTTTISGGNVTAQAGIWAAGIGSGHNVKENVFAIEISGGRITASSGSYGAGIGGGAYGTGGDISITGGTIYATGNRSAFIGNGWSATTSGTNTFGGGAIFTTLDTVVPAPVNSGSTNVYPVTFDIGVPNAIVTNFSGHVDYGIKDVRADKNGNVVFWLPPTGGTAQIDVTLNGESQPHTFYYIIESDGTVTIADTICVNGELVVGGMAGSHGTGWALDGNGIVSLTDQAASYTIQGVATNGFFSFSVPGGAAGLTLDGVFLVATNAENAPGIALSGTVPLTFRGTNAIVGQAFHANGITLADNANVTISGDGSLSVAGIRQYGSGIAVGSNATLVVAVSGDLSASAFGKYAAGIEVGGTAKATFAGTGTVVANGGKFAAGIGSRGGNTPCGHIEIQSGKVVATGGEKAAGIGGGAESNLQKDSIVISGGIVEGHGGPYAAGIGAGCGRFRGPDGSVRVSGGSVSACGDLTEAETGSLGGSFSSSDFAESQENTSPLTANEFKTIVITGGSVVPATLARVSPRPVDDGENLLYRVLMGGFEAGSEVAITCDGLPEGYSTDGIVADAGGRVCLWLPATNGSVIVVANGKYYAPPAPFENDADFDGGSDIPPESVISGDPDHPVVLWRVTVPELEPGAKVVLDISAETESPRTVADEQGRFFFYVADGAYTFNANGFTYRVLVDAGPAVAVRFDPDHPTGVFVDGTDVCNGFGKGWSYDSESFKLALGGDGFVVSGSNTEGRVWISVETNLSVTASNLTLAATNGAPAFAVFSGVSATLRLAGTNTLDGGENRAAVEVPDGASLEIGGDGTLAATGGENGAGIGGGSGKGCGTVAVSGGDVTATGGGYAAGIGGGNGGRGGTVAIDGGTVAATGGDNGAGIGGGRYGAVADIVISGGTVTARGGKWASGIGSGHDVQEHVFSITISGGFVTVESGSFASGIGGGSYGPCGAISITGGTVHPTGSQFAIGDGWKASSPGTNTFGGGAIFTTADAVSPAAADAEGTAVWPVKVPGLPANAAVTNLSIVALDSGLVDYGTNDLRADENGTVVLWLPDGSYTLNVNGTTYVALVAGGGTTAYYVDAKHPTGVFADGTDVCNGIGQGWAYDCTAATLHLAGDGLVLSGTNADGLIRVSVEADLSVTASNLTLAIPGEGAAFAVSSGVSASLVLVGDNALTAGKNHAAVEVPAGAALEIRGDGSLVAQGGENGAGIGGGGLAECGSVAIVSGTVTATGGKYAAGIGSGLQGTGGSIAISGGFVTATGGDDGAGIGGGQAAPGGAIVISGGTVHPQGGTTPDGTANGIGNGYVSSSSGTNTFSGGTIFATVDEVGPAAAAANGARVWPVTVLGLTPNAVIEDLSIRDGGGNPVEYGANDIVADDGGTVVLWLPNGTYMLEAEYYTYTVIVDDGPTSVSHATGVFVNGIDVGVGSGEGWLYDWTTAMLVPCVDNLVISGSNTNGQVHVAVPGGLTLVASNLTLVAASNSAAIILPDDASVMLKLAGENTLFGGGYHAAIEVPGSASLEICGDGKLDATGGDASAGIGGSLNQSLGSVTVAGGTIHAKGGESAAGIGGGANGSGGTVTIEDGIVTAEGGNLGAGIGGGSVGSGGTVIINGGTVSATGGGDGAGIGGGARGNNGGTVTISGGRVLAAGGSNAACIGGGQNGAAADVSITGGTVDFSGDSAISYPIGCGSSDSLWPPTTGSTVIGGGSVLLTDPYKIWRPAHDAKGAAVYPVEVKGLTPDSPVLDFVLLDGDSVPCDYGTKDIYANAAGEVVLWLPDGSYSLHVNGVSYIATVAGGPTVAEVDPGYFPTGVFVDGCEAGIGGGNGWKYRRDEFELVLSGDGLVLSGGNTNGLVKVAVAGQNIGVTASNLTLAAADGLPAFSISPGVSCVLTLAGENTLQGGANCAALEVPSSAALAISGGGSLAATGGSNGAGIGGSSGGSCGTVTVAGGNVEAQGGENAAGIGGGRHGSGGTVTLQSGLVTATGGKNGAGIGGGDATPDETRAANGGGGYIVLGGAIVAAIGGENAAGIGGGNQGTGGSIAIIAGTVRPVAGDGALAVGGGAGASGTGDVPVFAGGTIFTTADMVRPAPVNVEDDPVYPVAVSNLAPGAAVALSGLPDYYGTANIYADDEGRVVLWLPDGDWGGVDPTGNNARTFYANGYEYTISSVGGVNAAPGTVPAAAQGRALSLEGLEITGYSCDGGTVTLDVVAEPATWTHGFADTLSVRRADSLVPGAQDAPVNATPVLSSDGTVSFSLPVNPANRTSFFFISAPREE